jgi:hypothetical protein
MKSVDLESALQWLAIPREIARHPVSDEPISIVVGKFGPYLRCAGVSCSLRVSERAPSSSLGRNHEPQRSPSEDRGGGGGALAAVSGARGGWWKTRAGVVAPTDRAWHTQLWRQGAERTGARASRPGPAPTFPS